MKAGMISIECKEPNKHVQLQFAGWMEEKEVLFLKDAIPFHFWILISYGSDILLQFQYNDKGVLFTFSGLLQRT